MFEDGEPDPETGKGKRRQYLVNGEKLTSVTTVLGMLDKPGLKFASEKLGVAGAIELAREGVLPLNVEGAMSAMKARGLCPWQVWGRKAERGDVTHEELVALATGGELADLDSLPEEQQGFVRGAADWYADRRPKVIQQEVMVASVKHGFAGRHDFFGEIDGMPGRGLIDYKTTEELPRYADGTVKPPYDEHLLQLGFYEIGRVESGYEASDWQAVVRIDSTGAHDTCVSWVEPERSLAVLEAYKALKGIKETRPPRERAAA